MVLCGFNESRDRNDQRDNGDRNRYVLHFLDMDDIIISAPPKGEEGLAPPCGLVQQYCDRQVHYCCHKVQYRAYIVHIIPPFLLD